VDNTITPTATTPGVSAQATLASNAQEVAAGTATLGFDGYCPVSLKHANKWVKGKAEYGLVHRDRLYLFVGEKERQQFFANADAYSPVFSGLDPVLMLDQQASVPGSRQFGYRHKGAFYLFANQVTMQKFAQNPDLYSANVRQAMTRIDSLDAGGTIRR
jgi:YHS domain-containing protein